MRVLRYVLGAGLAAVALLVPAPSAHAAPFTFNFADPSHIGADPAGTSCFNGDDVCGTSLTWKDSSVEVTATGAGPDGDEAVIQDLFPDHGGLGVVHFDSEKRRPYFDSEGDEINEEQTLILTFDQAVILDTLSFFDEDHGPLGDDDTFMFAVNGGGFMEREFDYDFSGTQGTSFSFMYGGHEDEDFYLASVIGDPVPEPATLLLLGSGLTGLVLRRRRTRS